MKLGKGKPLTAKELKALEALMLKAAKKGLTKPEFFLSMELLARATIPQCEALAAKAKMKAPVTHAEAVSLSIQQKQDAHERWRDTNYIGYYA